MKYFSLMKKLEDEVRWQAIVIIVLVLALVVEGILLFRAYMTKTVIVLPPRIDREFYVSGNVLSFSYLDQTAKYLADRILSVSPVNVDSSLASTYPFLTTDPSQLKAIKDSFTAYANSIKQNDLWQAFYPLRTLLDERNQKVAVEGILKKTTGNVYVGEERKTIVFTYEVQNGRFIVREVKF